MWQETRFVVVNEMWIDDLCDGFFHSLRSSAQHSTQLLLSSKISIASARTLHIGSEWVVGAGDTNIFSFIEFIHKTPKATHTHTQTHSSGVINVLDFDYYYESSITSKQQSFGLSQINWDKSNMLWFSRVGKKGNTHAHSHPSNRIEHEILEIKYSVRFGRTELMIGHL